MISPHVDRCDGLGAVVTRQDNQSVLCKLKAIQCLNELTYKVVEFVNEVTVGANLGFALEVLPRK